jgi:hypothetical protein
MPIDEVIVTSCYKKVFLEFDIFRENENDKFWHKILATWTLIIQKEKEVEKLSQPLFFSGA